MMRRRRRACILAVLAFLAARPAFADNADLGTAVPDADIGKRMTGNTFSGVYKETGEVWAEYYCDTGKSLYDFRGRISLGKWWVLNDQVCFTYDWSGYKHIQCFAMYAKPDGRLTLVGKDPESGGTMTFQSDAPRAGDPYHMEERAAHGCFPEPSV
jgi:hypothetical protein